MLTNNLKCVDCDYIGATQEFHESRGDILGIEQYETIRGCPQCGGGMEKMRTCNNCEELFAQDELKGGLCYECIEELAKGTMAITFIQSTEQTRAFHDFVKYYSGEGEQLVKDFCLEDKSCWVEYLENNW